MSSHKKIFVASLAVSAVFGSTSVSAQAVIDEIMYDLSGSDTGREWVEIANTGSSPVTIETSSWKFLDATDSPNHGLTLSQGSATIAAGGFAVIANNAQKFLADWPAFSGTLFTASFSLSNTNATLSLKSDTTTTVDQTTYASTMGAAGDGNSLQKSNGTWKAEPSTPGFSNATSEAPPSNIQTPDVNSAAGTSNANNDSSSEDSSETSDVGGKSGWPVEPQIIARISGPAIGISGADVEFTAVALGLDKKEIANPRYVWNFGDGATKEGESVLHTYNFPGQYVVILEVSSGKLEGSSRLNIKVVSADISIENVVSGPDGRIELANNSKLELDVSWWRIQSGNQFFTLPKNTKILPQGHLPLSANVLGFAVDVRDVKLLYPNGAVAYTFDQGKLVPPAVTASPSPALTPTVTPVAPKSETPATVHPETSAPKKVSTVSATRATVSQTAGVAHAFSASTTATSTKSASSTSRSHSSWWFYGVGGVVILGLGFVLAPKQKPEAVSVSNSAKNAADEYTILEE